MTCFHRTKYFSAFLLGSILMIAYSCSSYRKTIKAPIKNHGTEYLIEQMKEREMNADYLTTRFSAEVKRNKDGFSFNGQLRIKKDSIIWISLSPALGLEMGRLIITQDSIKWMNRLESSYMLASVEQMAAIIHPLLDFDLLQALLLGNDLTMYENNMFKGSVENKEYKLSVTQRRKLRKQGRHSEIKNIPIQHLWLDPENFRITRVLIKDLQDKNAKIDARLDKFTEVSESLFALRREYEIEGGDNTLLLKITFTRPETPETSGFPFNIPEKYRPLRN